MSVIYRGPTRSYELTDTDVLWLARGFVGEHGEKCTRFEASALFASWMDRFLLVNGPWLKSGQDFSELLRAHSQPLNPIWADPGSAKCLKYPQYCTPKDIKRRKRISSLSKTQLAKYGVWEFAVDAQQGRLSRPIQESCYDFAAASLVEKQKRPCNGINLEGTRYLTYDCLKVSEQKGVVDQHAQVYIAASATTVGIVGGALAVGVGAFLSYLFSKLTE